MVLFIIAGCSNDQPAAESTQPAKAATEALSMAAAPAHQAVSAQYNLVFFLDPNGRPCRMQDAILSEMAGELQGKVAIRYVKTTVAADRNLFYQYGIRALPTLLLADASGNEIKRMPPGVKSADEVRLLIQSIPRS